MVATGSPGYRGQSAQRTAAELGDWVEGERKRKGSGSLSSVEAQGPRSRCQMNTEEVQTLCFLQFGAVFELVQAKSPQGRPARIAADFLSAESSSCLLAKAVEPD